MARILALILFGLAGAAILSSFGIWQMQRMQWKAGVLAQIESRIAAPPVPLPATPDPVADRYLAVTATGRFTGQDLRVLVSAPDTGPGARVIARFETADGRFVLVDRGFLADDDKGRSLPARPAEIVGNLNWPDETDSYTPPPDAKTGEWYARDVAAMAKQLNTAPVMIVARQETGDGILPLPVDTSSISNNHLGYAIQWFLMALAWLGMTGYALWRIRQPKT